MSAPAPQPRSNERHRWASGLVLVFALVAVTILFGVHAKYSSMLYAALVVTTSTIIGGSAWRFGAVAIRSPSDGTRCIALAGSFLVAPIALFGVLAGIGTPWQASGAENELRYVVLLLGALCFVVRIVLARQAMESAGERIHSTLSFAASLAAGTLYAFFLVVQLAGSRAAAISEQAGLPPPAPTPLDDASLVAVYFGVTLTYLATAALAAAMRRTRWMGAMASRLFATLGLLAAACIALRMAEAFAPVPGPLWGFAHAWAAPGFVLSIPAVPWMLPSALGIWMLRQARREASAAALPREG